MDNRNQIEEQQGKQPTLHWMLTFETIKQLTNTKENPKKFSLPGLLEADKPRILGVVESTNNALTAKDDSIFCSSTGSFSRNVL